MESFQSMKETLLSLSLEIEDRLKVIDLLKMKVESEKQSISNIPKKWLDDLDTKKILLQRICKLEQEKLLNSTKSGIN